jgi:hypothetical protein
MKHARRGQSLRWALTGCLAAVAVCGCSTVKHMLHIDQGDSQRAQQLLVMQIRVMRFADEYVGAIIEPLQRFKAATNNPEDRLMAQNWQVSQVTSAYTAATGPSPVVNALDMIVLATLSRMVVEDEWVTEHFGERATALRDAYRRVEAEARDIGKNVITPEQFAQLQRVIDEWRQKNPRISAVGYVHFLDFANSIGHPSPTEASSSTGLFHLLGIDPLSGLDPAVRELAQTRELGERAIYYAQRLPNLLDMQVVLVVDQFATTPDTKRVLADLDASAQAAAAAGRLAGEIPGLLAHEREAAIRQFMDAVTVETAHTRQLLTELRGTLQAGTATSDSLATTIRAFDQLVAQFEKPAPAGTPAAPPGRAFDITDYTAAAAQITYAAKELQQLIAGIEQGTPALAQSADHAAATLQIAVDHAYRRIVELIALLLVGGLAAALAYRGIARRWFA